MKKDTLKELNPLIHSIIEHNRVDLEKQVDKIVTAYEKDDQSRLAKEAKAFSEELQTVKITLSGLMSEYLQGRQEYASSKMRATFSGIFPSANKSIDQTSSSSSINYSSESQSSQTVLATNDYQNAFSNSPADQYSLKLYETINKLINQMTDYKTTDDATLEMAALLTEENKTKSENLYKTVQKICNKLMRLIGYKFDLSIEKLIYMSYGSYFSLPLNENTTKVVHSKTDRHRPRITSKRPTIIISHDGFKRNFHIYGNNGNEWQITDLDHEVFKPFKERFEGSAIKSSQIPKAIYLEILSKKGHVVTTKFKKNNMDAIRKYELNIATNAMKNEIIETINAYLKNYFFNELLPKRPDLKSYYRELTELKFERDSYISSKFLEQNERVVIREILKKREEAVMESGSKLGAKFPKLAEDPDNLQNIIAVFTDGKFIEILEDKFMPKVSEPSHGSDGPKL